MYVWAHHFASSQCPVCSPGQVHVGFVVHRDGVLSAFFSIPLIVSLQMRLWPSELFIDDIM
jgi:hypothetical protein